MSLTVNGVNLQTFAFNIEQRGSRWRTPKKRGSNFSLPGLHGTSQLLGKPYDENVFVLGMWAIGALPDGSVPSSAEELVLANLDMLTRLFSAPTITLVETRYDGDRTLDAEVTQVIDFASSSRATKAEFNVEIVVPSAFWFATGGATTQTIPLPAAATLRFTSFGTATAPLVNGVYEILGPVTSSVRLTDPVTGQWVQLNKPIPAGQRWIIDSAAWTSKLNGVSVIADTAHGNGTTLLDLSADALGCKLQISGTGMTAATSAKITARKAYLLA